MKRGLLLALPLVLAAAAFWLLSGGDEVGGAVHASAASPRSPEGATTRAPAAAAADRGEEGEARSGSAIDGDGSVPVPDDATWVEVLVVADEQPVAGATVCWLDQTTLQRIEKSQIDAEDRQWMYSIPDAIARRFGWQTHSDHRGIARVHLSEWTSVCVWHDGRYASATLQLGVPPPPGGHRIELITDLELRVQVLTADGTPAIGVPVQVVLHAANGPRIDGMSIVTRTEAPEGLARLQHLQNWNHRHWGIDATVVEWRVRPHLVGSNDPGIRFDPKAPPAETLVLRLPAFGSVKARIEYRGRPIRGGRDDAGVWLFCGALDDWQARNRGLYRPIGADGWAHFSCVPLGISVTAAAQVSGELYATVPGPLQPGQEVTIALAPEGEQIVITGRVLDEQRQPLRDTRVDIQLQGKELGANDTPRTDAEGRFLVFAGKPREQNRLDQLVVMLHDPEAEPLRGDTGPRDLVVGEQDLGDIVLTREPLVVSGNLLTGDQPYRRQIPILVQRFGQSDEGRMSWEYEPLQARFDERGGFTIRGRVREGRYRLSFPSVVSLPIAPIEFTPGATGVKIPVDPGSGLVATFRLPGEIQEQLHAVLRPGRGVTVPAIEDGNADDRFKVDIWSWERRSQAQWQGLPSGSYTLEVRLEFDDEPLLVIPDVQVPPPDNGDPRLRDIDLRDRIAVVELRFADSSGTPLQDRQGLVFPLGQDASKDWHAVPLSGESARIVSRPRPLDLLVTVQGFQPQEVRGVRSDTVVRLHAWPEIELVLAGLPALPQGVQLFAQLTPPADEGEGSYHTRWDSGSRSSYSRPEHERAEVRSGRVRLPIGEGAHALTVWIGKGEDGFHLDGVKPGEVVYGGAGTVQVQVPLEVLQRALERLAK